MLANAYGMYFLLYGLWWAVISLIVAIIVEAPLAAKIWRMRTRGVLRAVWLANLLSAATGAFPVFFGPIAQAPKTDVEPWVYHTNFWSRHLHEVALLFVVTLVIELTVYLIIRWRSRLGISWCRLTLGAVAANAVSYMLLMSCFAVRPSSTGDFEFLPDTRWIQSPDTRVWYLDPKLHQLHSILLDGTGERIEVAEELRRVNGVWEDYSLYAVVPSADALLYLHKNNNWRVATGGLSRSLGEGVDGDQQDPTELLERATLHPPEKRNASESRWPRGVYSSEPKDTRPFAMSSDNAEYRVRSSVYWYDGTGNGVIVEDKRSGLELVFAIPAGTRALACWHPELFDQDRVVFRCGNSILLMDISDRKVGRLVRGDSAVAVTVTSVIPPATQSTTRP